MKCTSCGNEIIGGAKFCGKCGTKVEIQSPSPAPMTALIQPEFSAVGVKMKRGNGKKIGFIVILSIAVCLIGFFVVKNMTFSPTGVWISRDTEIEMKFHRNGKLQIGMRGIFIGDLKWEKESENIYYLSGEASGEIIDLGDIGTYAEYDKEKKILIVDLGMGEAVFRRK